MLVQDIAGLYIPPHDFVLIEYRESSPGIGEIGTVTYKSGGASGKTVAVLTLAYDSNTNKLESISKA